MVLDASVSLEETNDGHAAIRGAMRAAYNRSRLGISGMEWGLELSSFWWVSTSHQRQFVSFESPEWRSILECSPGRIPHKDLGTEAYVSGNSIATVSPSCFTLGVQEWRVLSVQDSLWLSSDGFLWSGSSKSISWRGRHLIVWEALCSSHSVLASGSRGRPPFAASVACRTQWQPALQFPFHSSLLAFPSKFSLAWRALV